MSPFNDPPQTIMDRTPHPPLTDNEIHALADGQGAADTLARLQARLAHDPSAQATLAAWQRQREVLRGLHQNVLTEPLPLALTTTVQHCAATQQDINQWWRWGGMAASIVLAFGVGWFSNAVWRGDAIGGEGGGGWGGRAVSAWMAGFRPATQAKARLEQDFVRQASFAYAVYSPEVRHPVEVSAVEQDHLVKWLSKRVGKPLKIPLLTAQGFDLVGGRLLSGDTGAGAGARAQFMYQSAAGLRITLYLGAVNIASAKAGTGDTAFSFASQGDVHSFYWVDQGFGYALSGPMPREVLIKLADEVYRQL